MKHPNDWTETEKERFKQRHEAMRKEIEEQLKKYCHEFYTAAERIVEKYRNVKFLDEEQVKMSQKYIVDFRKEGTSCSCAKDHAEGCKKRTAKCLEVKG